MIPEFDGEGEEAWGWMIKVVQHFEAEGTPEAEQLPQSVKMMRGRVAIWYCCWSTAYENATWWDFVMALLEKFQPGFPPEFEQGEVQHIEETEPEFLPEKKMEEKKLYILIQDLEDRCRRNYMVADERFSRAEQRLDDILNFYNKDNVAKTEVTVATREQLITGIIEVDAFGEGVKSRWNLICGLRMEDKHRFGSQLSSRCTDLEAKI